MPLAGGDPERLTFDSAMSFAPAVSPDGREVAFHSLREGNRDIYVMPAEGGPRRAVSHSPAQGFSGLGNASQALNPRPPAPGCNCSCE